MVDRSPGTETAPIAPNCRDKSDIKALRDVRWRSRRSGFSPLTTASSASRRSAPRPARTAMTSIVSAISARGTVTTASWISCSSRRSAPSAEPAWIVPMPPGCPVPQAFRRSSASAPRTSPIGMRSGRNRSEDRTSSDSEATPSLVRSATRFGRAALQFARVLDQHHSIGRRARPRRAAHW